MLADVLDAAELLGVRARGYPVNVPIPVETFRHHQSTSSHSLQVQKDRFGTDGTGA